LADVQRVVVDVAKGFEAVAVVLDRRRAESSPKEWPIESVAIVEFSDVFEGEAVYSNRDSAPGRSNQKVVMVAHEAERKAFQETIADRLAKEMEKQSSVDIVGEDVVSPGSSVVDVIDAGIGVVAQLTWHDVNSFESTESAVAATTGAWPLLWCGEH
jgi:hypothetical protein